MRLSRTRLGAPRGEHGFTLVELLIVMLIIGILAAVAIPSYFNQRDKAHDADAKSVVRAAATAIEAYFTESETYAGVTPATLALAEPVLSGTVSRGGLTVTSTADTYTLTVISRNTPNSFRITRMASGATLYTCDLADVGGCGTGGVWG